VRERRGVDAHQVNVLGCGLLLVLLAALYLGAGV